MQWEERIKSLLKKVVLYQFGKYPAEKLDEELTRFLKDAETVVCKVLRKNGAICFREYVEDYGVEEAEKLVENDARNFEMLGTGGKLIADLIRISRNLYDVERKPLSEKILLFDKVIHAEHWAGAFKDYLAEEKSIFGVDIPKIKNQVDMELMKELYGTSTSTGVKCPVCGKPISPGEPWTEVDGKRMHWKCFREGVA